MAQQALPKIFGSDMSGINVHASSPASALGAQAYAQGSDIHAAGGEPAMPHEAWHVAQQKQGRVAPTTDLFKDQY